MINPAGMVWVCLMPINWEWWENGSKNNVGMIY